MKASWMMACVALCGAMSTATAHVGVSPGGLPSYSMPIGVPPGIGGMTPQLSLLYAGVGVNGPLGHGWSVQGTSSISRCPSTREIDGVSKGVAYTVADRLCLDGQRLVRTTAAGVPQGTTDDARGIAGSGYTEFRTEKDSFVRVRAYGYWGNSADLGPRWFRVWTKAGQVFDYGHAPSNPVGAIVVEKPGAASADRPVMTWAIARQSDTPGNYIDYAYTRRTRVWGSGPVADTPTAGTEWNLAEIRYTGFSGTPARTPNNRIVFDYADRPLGFTDSPYDPAETYQAGFKNLSIARLTRIRAFVGTDLPQPVLVRSLLFTYDNSPVSGRSRLVQIKECFGESSAAAGEPGARCLQPVKFEYAATGTHAIAMNQGFNLKNLEAYRANGTRGVMAAISTATAWPTSCAGPPTPRRRT